MDIFNFKDGEGEVWGSYVIGLGLYDWLGIELDLSLV